MANRMKIAATTLERWAESDTYYSFEDAESTRADREFTTSLFAAGVTIGMGELFGW